MTSRDYHQASPMYPEPDDSIRPIPPVRAEFQSNPQEEGLLPQAPHRMDIPGPNTSTTTYHHVIKDILLQ